MILIIAKYPTAANDKDGMMQRITAIDKILDNCDKIYLDINYKNNLKITLTRVSTNTRVYKTNIVLGIFLAAYLAFHAKRIYVHSVLNAIKVLPLYTIFNKIITDMHGIVPEELYMEGRIYWSKIFNIVEHIVYKKSLIVITVTNAMSEYLKKKYKPINNIMTVSIFDTTFIIKKNYTINSKLTIIYSGGTQKWQNIDMMLDAIKCTISKYNYIILSGDIGIIKNKLLEMELHQKVMTAAVNKDEIYSWYAKADLGFVLREDIAVNNVACPTKLIEYLINGVVPIVIHPNIGDFDSMGYCYITLDEFLNDRFSVNDIVAKRQHNYKVIKRYQKLITDGINGLKNTIKQ